MNGTEIIGRRYSVQNRKKRDGETGIVRAENTGGRAGGVLSVGRSGMLPCLHVSPKTLSVSTDIVV